MVKYLERKIAKFVDKTVLIKETTSAPANHITTKALAVDLVNNIGVQNFSVVNSVSIWLLMTHGH